MQTFNTLVIGGGISGLSVAHYLHEHGCKSIAVVEKDAGAYSIFSERTDTGFLSNMSANSMRYSQTLLNYLKSIDLEYKLQTSIANTKFGILYNNKVHQIPDNQVSALKCAYISYSQIIKTMLGKKFYIPKKDISVYDYFVKIAGHRFAQSVATPMLTSIYGAVDLYNMSTKYALYPYIKKSLDHPAVDMLISKASSKMLTLSQGMRDIIKYSEASLKKNDVKVYKNMQVVSISKQKDEYNISLVSPTGKKSSMIVNNIVSTVKFHDFIEMNIPHNAQPVPSMSYSPVGVMNVGYNVHPDAIYNLRSTDQCHAWLVDNSTSNPVSLIGFTDNSRLFPELYCNLESSLFTLYYEPRNEQSHQKAFAEWQKIVGAHINHPVIISHHYNWMKHLPFFELKNHDKVIQFASKIEENMKNFYIVSDWYCAPPGHGLPGITSLIENAAAFAANNAKTIIANTPKTISDTNGENENGKNDNAKNNENKNSK